MRFVTRHLGPLAWAVSLCLLVAGCQSLSKPKAGWVFFPPPAEPRVPFLTWASGADEVETQRGAFAEFVLGREPAIKRAIQKPYGFAALNGVVYVCDAKGRAIGRLDFDKRDFSALGVFSADCCAARRNQTDCPASRVVRAASGFRSA